MRTPSMADVVLLVETSALSHNAIWASMRATVGAKLRIAVPEPAERMKGFSAAANQRLYGRWRHADANNQASVRLGFLTFDEWGLVSGC